MFFTEQSTGLRSGWAVGTGAEFAVADGWSLKGEYLYAKFGAEEFLFPSPPAGVVRNSGKSTGNTISGRVATNEAKKIKMGLNYHL